jgi:hypothetical protein
MKHTIKGISLLLGLVVLYTLVYKSVHVVVHHYPEKDEVHCCELHVQFNCNVGAHQIASESDTESDCPVCDFEFASFQIQQRSSLQPFQFNFCQLTYSISLSIFKHNYRSALFLRGPPSKLSV